MHFFFLLPMESFLRFEVSFLSAKWLTFLEEKSLQGMQKVLWLIYWHSQNPLKLRQVARHHLMRMPNVWHKSAWKPAKELGVEVHEVGRGLGRQHIHTHNLFLMSAFCRETDQKSLPQDFENLLGAGVWMLQIERAVFSQKHSFIRRAVYELGGLFFWGEHQRRIEMIVILHFIIC